MMLFLFFTLCQCLEDGLKILGGALVVESFIHLVWIVCLGFDAIAVLIIVVSPFVYLTFLSASRVRENQVLGLWLE